MAQLELTHGMMGAAVEALRDAERVALAGVGRTLVEARRRSRKQRRVQREARWARILKEAGIERADASVDGMPFMRSRSKEDG